MQVGMIGLGRMGMNMSVRLMGGGHQVVGFNRDRERVKQLEERPEPAQACGALQPEMGRELRENATEKAGIRQRVDAQLLEARCQ